MNELNGNKMYEMLGNMSQQERENVMFERYYTLDDVSAAIREVVEKETAEGYLKADDKAAKKLINLSDGAKREMLRKAVNGDLQNFPQVPGEDRVFGDLRWQVRKMLMEMKEESK